MLRELENGLIYYPTTYPLGNWAPAGLDFEDAYFTSDDDVTLHGWYCPAPPRTANVLGQGPRPVFFYCHGNAGNLSDRAPALRIWQEVLGADVFIFDYRGYGRSGGRPSEAGLYRDSRAAYRWLTEQKGVDPARIVLRGGSLGGAVALELGLEAEHRCLILESTFTSLPDVAKGLYPWMPVHFFMATRFPNRERIARYRRPVLLLHGTQDSLVPVEQSRELFSLANEPKTLFEVEGADHNDTLLVGGRRYLEVVRDFLFDAFRGPADRPWA